MSDIMERLRGLADLFEAGDAPRHVVMHMRAGADEIERLRGRLEIDPSHPYDGIYCRDETIRGLEKQIANLLNALADARTESMKLRAALELYRDAVRIDATMEGPKFMGANSSALKRAWDADRAALEGRT